MKYQNRQAEKESNLKDTEHGWLLYMKKATMWVKFIEIESPETATVQFLNRGFKDIFRWPRIDDVADIASQFVFLTDLKLLRRNNGRTWHVQNLENVDNMYIEYKNTFF